MKSETGRLGAVLVLYALMPVLLILTPHLFKGVEMTAYSAAYNAYMVLVEFSIIALPALIWFLTPWGRSTAKSFWMTKPSAAILLMIPLAFCAYFCMNGVTIAWYVFLQQLGIAQIPETVPPPQTGAQLGIGLAVIALSPALCEEFFFRGVLQPALHRNMKPWVAIMLSGCLFGLLHGQIVALPAHVILGMGLCLVAYWTRSVWYTMVWHLMQNGITMVLSYFSNQILQATEAMAEGAGASADAAVMLAEQPLIMLFSAGSMIVLFGAGTALFLALLYIATKSHRVRPVEKPEGAQRAHWLAYMPLLAAAVCIVYSYVINTIPLLGGGV